MPNPLKESKESPFGLFANYCPRGASSYEEMDDEMHIRAL